MECNLQDVATPYSKNGEKELDDTLLLAVTHILKAPGDRKISKLLNAFNFWMDVPEDKLAEIDAIVNTLYNASLLIDDIEDSASIRNGLPVAHKVHGVPATINGATYAIFVALERCVMYNSQEITDIFYDQILRAHIGQGLEIYWRDKSICPTEEEYCEMAIEKIGSILTFIVLLLQHFSKNKSDFTNLVELLAQYLEILKDYQKLTKSDLEKNQCDYLTEGKFSFPVVHAINSQPNDTKLIQILKLRTNDEEVTKYYKSLLEKQGSLEYTKTKLRDLRKELAKEIRKLGGNSCMEKLLECFFNVDGE